MTRKYTTSFMVAIVLVLSAVLFVNSGNYITGFVVDDEWNTSTSSVSETEATPTMGIPVLTDGADDIDLTANSTTTVYCHAIVNDANGASDIITGGGGNITVYENAVGSDCTANYRNCYRNTTFSADTCVGTGNGTAVNCTFTIDLYFNAANTTAWKCNMTIDDATEKSINATSAVATVENLVAIGINTSTMSFGPGESLDFAANEVVQQISNVGNVVFDLTLNGSTMICSGAGEDIAPGNITYNITGSSGEGNWGDFNLTTGQATKDFKLYSNESATAVPIGPVNSTWWKLYMPQAAASRGTCEGVIWFFATQS
jgi:hypothetical protein